MARNEDGFTLVEMLTVVVVMSTLLAVVMGFQAGARSRAGDATAQMNIRIAEPAIAAYFTENGTYAGMTLGSLQSSYSPGVQGIDVLAADSSAYCVRASAEGRTWYERGPGGTITQTACP